MNVITAGLGSTTATAAARLDRLPILPFHRRLLGLIGAGMFFDGFDVYLAGAVLGTLVHDGWSTVQLNANFISATFFGMLIGAFSAGILGDRYGRKFTYQFNLGIFGLASLAAAAAPSMTWLIAFRFVAGVGLGAEIVIGYGAMAEFTPPSHRGRWAALLSFLTNSGLFASTLVSYLLIPYLGWRIMFVIAGVGALVVLWLRRAIPESPRWLEQNGRRAEADAILAMVEAQATSPLPAPTASAPSGPAPALFSGPMVRRLAVGGIMHIAVGIAIYGFIAWVPTFLVQQGISLNRSLGQSVLMSLGGPVGALLGWALSDRMGRRPAIIIFSLVAAATGVAFANAHSQEVATALGFALFTLVYLLVAFIVAGYVPELFPTAIRMRGNGICNSIGRLVTIFVPQAVPVLLGLGGVAAVLSAVVGILIIQAATAWLAGTETRGQSLEAIAQT